LLVPAVAAQRLAFKIAVHAVNYVDQTAHLEGPTVRDWSAGRGEGRLGFGEAVNYLFQTVAPPNCFFVVNPDSFPMPGCLARMVAAYESRHAAIIEARQWPHEHPKEYDAETGATPWASGAFLLISSDAFRRLNGFDPVFFLYNEDVDLSWRAWLNNMPIYYARDALCTHFTGLLSYRQDRFYLEQFYSIRNFIALAYKFFGDYGETHALAHVELLAAPAAFRRSIIESYRELRPRVQRYNGPAGPHRGKVKILGMNLYHRVRAV
jgi:GT2 family glycosyltransferase